MPFYLLIFFLIWWSFPQISASEEVVSKEGWTLYCDWENKIPADGFSRIFKEKHGAEQSLRLIFASNEEIGARLLAGPGRRELFWLADTAPLAPLALSGMAGSCRLFSTFTSRVGVAVTTNHPLLAHSPEGEIALPNLLQSGIFSGAEIAFPFPGTSHAGSLLLFNLLAAESTPRAALRGAKGREPRTTPRASDFFAHLTYLAPDTQKLSEVRYFFPVNWKVMFLHDFQFQALGFSERYRFRPITGLKLQDHPLVMVFPPGITPLGGGVLPHPGSGKTVNILKKQERPVLVKPEVPAIFFQIRDILQGAEFQNFMIRLGGGSFVSLTDWGNPELIRGLDGGDPAWDWVVDGDFGVDYFKFALLPRLGRLFFLNYHREMALVPKPRRESYEREMEEFLGRSLLPRFRSPFPAIADAPIVLAPFNQNPLSVSAPPFEGPGGEVVRKHIMALETQFSAGVIRPFPADGIFRPVADEQDYLKFQVPPWDALLGMRWEALVGQGIPLKQVVFFIFSRNLASLLEKVLQESPWPGADIVVFLCDGLSEGPTSQGISERENKFWGPLNRIATAAHRPVTFQPEEDYFQIFDRGRFITVMGFSPFDFPEKVTRVLNESSQ